MCQMDIVEERQAALTNSKAMDTLFGITDEINELRESTLYYAVELGQTTWCIGSARVRDGNIEDAKALARTDALRAAAIFDMVQSGMICECGKHRIEYKSIPWNVTAERKDSFLTGYIEIECTLPHMALP